MSTVLVAPESTLQEDSGGEACVMGRVPREQRLYRVCHDRQLRLLRLLRRITRAANSAACS